MAAWTRFLISTRSLAQDVRPLVVITQGDLVSVAWNGFSTQTSGKSYEFAAVELFRVVDGKIVEIWNSREARGLWS